jgi:hypothetical protein
LLKLVFVNAFLEAFGRSRSKGAWALFSAPLTQEVIDGMGWSEMADWLKGGTPDGDLAASNIELLPNDVDLAGLRTDVRTAKVHNFKIHRLELEGTKGAGHRLEVRFRVEVSDESGCEALDHFMLGAQKCRLTVSYAPAAKQGDLYEGGERVDVESGDREEQAQLPLAAAEDTAGCADCDNGISMADDTMHVNGNPCAVVERNREALKPSDDNESFVRRSKEHEEKRRRARARVVPPEPAREAAFPAV